MKLICLTLLCGLFASATCGWAQEAPAKPTPVDQPESTPKASPLDSLKWIVEGKASLGSNAELTLTNDFRATASAAEASKFLKLSGNLPDPSVSSILLSLGNAGAFWVMFSFNDAGYVKDDEKDKIDANALMKSMRESQTEANKERKRQGLETLTLAGWAVKPFYNEESKSVEFGTLVKGETGEATVNYETKILGRRGFMNVTLLCNPDRLNEALPKLREQLKSFTYKKGETYAEYTKGDKVAQYGLTALIAGGGIAVAAKTGILAKMGKAIFAVIAAVCAGIAKFWRSITGRRKSG